MGCRGQRLIFRAAHKPTCTLLPFPSTALCSAHPAELYLSAGGCQGQRHPFGFPQGSQQRVAAPQSQGLAGKALPACPARGSHSPGTTQPSVHGAYGAKKMSSVLPAPRQPYPLALQKSGAGFRPRKPSSSPPQTELASLLPVLSQGVSPKATLRTARPMQTHPSPPRSSLLKPFD